MGGLVARHYATLPEYFSPRNRKQGDFSEVITIDTPENGSALANALLDPNPFLAPNQNTTIANSTLSSSAALIPTGWWNTFCNSSDTLGTCFYNQLQPIVYQGYNNDCGAIASLQSGYSGIGDSSCGFVNAPMGFQNAPVHLPNAATFHLAAYFDDATAPGYSLLRFGLDQYVQAVSPGNSLDQILGNIPDGTEPNDVIVTVASQVDNLAFPPGSAAAPNLEHTAALTGYSLAASVLEPIFTFSDANVMNSNVVNAAILCVLLSSGQNSSCVTEPVSDMESTREMTPAVSQSYPESQVHQFLAEGRVEVLAPAQPLKLAEENEIALRIHAPGLTRVSIEQANITYVPRERAVFDNSAYALLPVLHRDDGSTYIKVTPRFLGQLILRLKAFFPDGGLTKTDTIVTVEPPERVPTNLVVGQIGEPTTNLRKIWVYLKPDTDKYALTVGVFYEGLKDQIRIDGSYVSFKIRTKDEASIIELDKYGSIKPLQLGEAVVETTFGGWTNLTCVLVENEYHPQVGPTSNCQSLLLPGEKLATPTRQ
jgi:hypothetical protein